MIADGSGSGKVRCHNLVVERRELLKWIVELS
jgi:hypothetical protein